MKITAIKAQAKNPDRVRVYVDEKYSFSLNYTQLLDQKIKVGLELNQAKLDELKKTSEFGKAYERALNYVMIRPRSVREVQQYGRRKQWSQEDAQAIIEKLQARHYLNNAAFAKSWVRSRQLSKKYSVKKLRLELKQKGVADDEIAEALESSDYDELAALKALVAKKQKLARYKADPQKLMQYLARQGFSYDDIKTVVES